MSTPATERSVVADVSRARTCGPLSHGETVEQPIRTVLTTVRQTSGMGWNCAFGVIARTTVEDVVRAGVTPIGDPLPGDLTLSSDGLALQQHGSSVIVV